MTIFSAILGSKSVIDSGIKSIDAMIFTDEEKAKAKIALLASYEPFKVAQRYLALIFSIPYMTAWTATFAASFFINVDKQIELLTGDIGVIVGVIVGFYFLGGVGTGFKK